MTVAESFLALYSPHSIRSYGEYREGDKDPAKTIKLRPGLMAVENHLSGRVGLGLVPLDIDQCGWGVIDIDSHGDEGDVDLKGLALKFSSFPGTVVTRSKSGGAHIYFFFKEAITGKQARSVIHQVALATDLAGNEIFPKQNKIRPDGWGNWINLPYFGGNSTNRFGVTEDGEQMTLESFVATSRTTPMELERALEQTSIGAPPCIDHLLMNPPPQGQRNMALFSLAVFFKRSAPDRWKDKTQEYALTRMDPPLPLQEIRNVLGSVARTDYTYRCTESPLVDLCNKEKCSMARHGLTIEQQGQQGSPVGFKSLTKYLTEPPVWDLQSELGPIRLTTKALLSHSMIREAIAERYLKIVPKLKTEEWHALLADLMSRCSIIEVPEDSTPSGLVWNALVEYASVAFSDMGGGDDDEDDDSFKVKWDAGLPVRRNGNLYFQGNKYISWLRRAKRAEGLTPSAIYMALKEKGVEQDRIRIDGDIKRTWVVSAAQMRKSFPVYKAEDEEF